MTFGPFKHEGMFLLYARYGVDAHEAHEILRDLPSEVKTESDCVGTCVYGDSLNIWLGNLTDTTIGEWFAYIYEDMSEPQDWMLLTYEQAFAFYLQGKVSEIVTKQRSETDEPTT